MSVISGEDSGWKDSRVYINNTLRENPEGIGLISFGSCTFQGKMHEREEISGKTSEETLEKTDGDRHDTRMRVSLRSS